MAVIKCYDPLRSRAWHRLFDKVGMLVSALCAVHCLVTPWLMILFPSLLLALYSHRHPQHHLAGALLWFTRWEWVVALVASAVATGSTWKGYRTHGQWPPLGCALAGSSLLLAASSVPSLQQSITTHALLAVLGGSCLVCAHLDNLRRLQYPTHDRRRP